MTLDAPDIPAPFRERASDAGRDGWRALRLLRERSWIYALLGVVALSACFVLLGRWQFGRHLTRSARNDQITSNYASAPVPLESLLPALRTDRQARVPLAVQWRPVRVSGTYLPQDTVLIRNRPYSTGANDTSNGYEVIVPLQLSSGTVLLVNRGWIPASDTSASQPDSVPPPPAGTVTVVARLRPSERGSSKAAPSGQAIRINARQLASRLPVPLNQRVLNGFAVLSSETPPARSTPAALEPPDPGIGINLAYAVQWWLFAIAAYVLLAVAGIKEVRRRAAARPSASHSPSASV